ncbi:DUF5988 family protein [Streptomyces syringium]|uniref:DUF5988 family protein n=1 Tax=Streptomyces syringium TaxID=76729 RepID=UPI0034517E52
MTVDNSAQASALLPPCHGQSGDAQGTERLVILRGGAPELPRLYRLPDGHADMSRVVVAFYGRHHRFVPTGEMERVEGGRLLSVFQSSYSTATAE